MRVLGLGDNVFDSYDNLGVLYPGGNAVNVAVNAARLGHDAAYLGRVADDGLGAYMLCALDAEGVDTAACTVVGSSTTKVCHETFDGNDRSFLYSEVGDDWAGNVVLGEADVAYAADFDLIMTSCNAKCTAELPKLANRRGFLAFDFGEKDKYRTPEYFAEVLPWVDLALFSMSGAGVDDVVALAERLDGKPMLATRGTATPVFVCDGRVIEGAAHEDTAVDAMGAGDAFLTAFCTRVLEGGSLPAAPSATALADAAAEALAFAATHAARMCQEHGAFGHALRLEAPRLVMFDMDGVIVETEPFYVQLHKDLLAQYGKELTPEDERQMYGISNALELQMMQRYLEMPADECLRVMDAYFGERQLSYPEAVIEGVPELLAYLTDHGVQCALASSSPRRDIDRMLATTGLDTFFSATVSGDEFDESKPNPAIYLHILKDLGVCADEAFIVEDSNYGIQAGVNAGVRVLALKKGHGNADLRQCHLAFETPAQVLGFMRLLCERS